MDNYYISLKSEETSQGDELIYVYFLLQIISLKTFKDWWQVVESPCIMNYLTA
jgi:hypothetical protein